VRRPRARLAAVVRNVRRLAADVRNNTGA